MEADEKRVRSIGVGRDAGVARFSSGSSQAGASGRPVGARGKNYEKTSIVRGSAHLQPFRITLLGPS